MPTLIFKVDCGKSNQPLKHELYKLENKVQEALTELDYEYLVYETEEHSETLLDFEAQPATTAGDKSALVS